MTPSSKKTSLWTKDMLGARLHQGLSFSCLFTHIPQAPVLFWPGCSLMGLGYPVLHKTLEVLARSEPEIKLAAACCGKPSRSLGLSAYKKRRAWLLQSLAETGCRTIYTACPHCTEDLEALAGEGNFTVKTIWRPLQENLQASDLASPPDQLILHDPCPLRQKPQVRAEVRELLSQAGINWQEPAHTGAKTICCGQVEMLHVLDPPASEKLTQQRLKDFTADQTICSYCQSCLNRFAAHGYHTAHVLETLFGVAPQKGWSTRFKLVRQIKGDQNA